MDHSIISDVVVRAERLHKQLLDSIQLELDHRNIRDLNDVRALMLLNIGDAEMTVSELLWRGCYLGTNVSYNLKKLTEAGYVTQERSQHDKRVFMVRNSPKGLEICHMLQSVNARRCEALVESGVTDAEIEMCRRTLKTLQRIWSQPAPRESAGGEFGEAQGWRPQAAPGESYPAPARDGASPLRAIG